MEIYFTIKLFVDYIFPFLGVVFFGGFLVWLLSGTDKRTKKTKKAEKFLLSRGYKKKLLYGDEFYLVRDSDNKSIALKAISNMTLKEVKAKYK